MKEPKILLARLERIFQACCFFLAIYYITFFSSQFLQNQDTTFISMKTFNEGTDDYYPEFSICFKGSNFHWLYAENVFKSYGINPVQFEVMLKDGQTVRDEFEKTSSVYQKKPVAYNDGRDVNFDKYHLKSADFVHELDLGHLLHVVPHLLVRVTSHHLPQPPLGPALSL